MTALAPNDSPSAPLRLLLAGTGWDGRQIYAGVLRDRGFEVISAPTLDAAMFAIQLAPGAVDVVIAACDPDGVELARGIGALLGPRPTIYLSDWAEEFVDLSNAPGRWVVMQQPADVETLVAAVQRLTAASDRNLAG